MKYLAIFTLSFFLFSCAEEIPNTQDFPILRTLPPVLDETGASFQAEILNEGKSNLDQMGFTWSRTIDPSISNSDTTLVLKKTSSFSKIISYGLDSGFLYTVRAFAIYGDDHVVYGNPVQFISQGGQENAWKLVRDDIRFDETWGKPYAGSSSSNAYVIFQSSDFFHFNQNTKSFDKETKFPHIGGLNARFLFASLDENIYLSNGSTRNNNFPRSLFTFQNNSWSEVVPRILTHHEPSLIYFHERRLYSIRYPFAWEFNFDANTWIQLESSAVGSQPTMGFTTNSRFAFVALANNELWQYDAMTNLWSYLTSIPIDLDGDGFSWNQNYILFFDENKIYTGLLHNPSPNNDEIDKELWSYDLTTFKWKQERPLPAEIENEGILFSFGLNSKLFVGIKDIRSNGYSFYQLWSFDPKLR